MKAPKADLESHDRWVLWTLSSIHNRIIAKVRGESHASWSYLHGEIAGVRSATCNDRLWKLAGRLWRQASRYRREGKGC